MDILYCKLFQWIFCTVENNIPHTNISYSHYLKQVCINKSFYLRPVTADEIHDIIKSMGPNSINHMRKDYYCRYCIVLLLI